MYPRPTSETDHELPDPRGEPPRSKEYSNKDDEEVVIDLTTRISNANTETTSEKSLRNMTADQILATMTPEDQTQVLQVQEELSELLRSETDNSSDDFERRMRSTRPPPFSQRPIPTDTIPTGLPFVCALIIED